jgi:hypothetical protein
VAAVNVRRTPRTQVTGEELCSVFEVPGCLVEVSGNLQVHPEFRRCVQDTGKEDGSSGSHVTLAVVESFEAFDGFGIMSNTYDPIDFLVNAVGIAIALLIDTKLRGRRASNVKTQALSPKQE